MLHAIRELGMYYNAVQQRSGLETMVQDCYEEDNYPHCLLITFSGAATSWQYGGIKYIENGRVLRDRLIYRRGASKGPDLSPTSKVTDLPTTMKTKIKGWFASNVKIKGITLADRAMIKALQDEFLNRYDDILEDLGRKKASLEGNAVISLALIGRDGVMKLPGEITLLRNLLELNVINSYQAKYNTQSVAPDQLCSVCGKRAKEVFGFFSELKFYTVDKPGMVTGGCRQPEAWKNFPVCLDCAAALEAGFELVQKKMTFKFHGLRYFLIPHFMHQGKRNDLLDLFTDEVRKKQRIDDTSRQRFTNDEQDLLYELKDADNNLCLNFFFFGMPQKSVLRILANIEDVFPSRLRTLFQVKEAIDGLIFFDHRKKDGAPLFRFDFGSLREFFPASKNKAFLEVVSRVFTGRPLSFAYLIENIMENLRRVFIDSPTFLFYQTMRAFMVCLYLNRLGLLTGHQREVLPLPMLELKDFIINSKEEFPDKVNQFFEAFPGFFLSDAHRFIFLNGVLTQFLLNIQKHERKSDPFRKQLKGLKMTGKDIVGLLPRIQEKLEQYEKNYYRPLEKQISRYAVAAGHHSAWRIPLDEINFIFTLGMNLREYFKIKTEEDSNHDHDNQTV